MRFVPSYKLEIIPEENFNTEISKIEEALLKYVNTGYFTAFDKTKIFYEYFLCENSKATVVIVHGLSEFTKKFYEVIYYFLNQGYNVFIHDQRCHGLSDRLTKQRDLLHVDSFNDYAKDLSQFIEEIVTPNAEGPIYIYSHSMGGAISAIYLAQNPNKIKKAVFSAPLFEPVVKKVSNKVARASAFIGRLLVGGKKRFFINRDFDPNVEYKEAFGSSKVRFDYNIKLRRENPMYQSTPMSYGWVYNSLAVHSQVFGKRVIDKIKTPILLISAEKDTTVKTARHEKFAKQCDNCTFMQIEDEGHALLSSCNATLERVLKATFDFLS